MRLALVLALVGALVAATPRAAAQSGPGEDGGGAPTGISAGQLVDQPERSVLDAALGLGDRAQMTVSVAAVGDWFSEFTAADGREGDEWRTSAVFRLAYQTNWGRRSLFLANSFSLSHAYQTGEFFVSYLNFSGTFSHQGERLFSSMTGTIVGGNDPGNFSAGNITRERSDRLQMNVAGRMRYQMSPRVVLSLTDRLTRSDRAENFDEAGVRFEPSLVGRNSLSAEVEVRQSEITSWTFGYDNVYVRREAEGQGNTFEHAARVGLGTALSDRATARVRYAFRRARRTQRSDANTHQLFGTVGYAVAERLGVAVSGSAETFKRLERGTIATNFNVVGSLNYLLSEGVRVGLGGGVAVLETEADGRRVVPVTEFSLIGSIVQTGTTTVSVETSQRIENTVRDADDVGFVLRSRAGVDVRHQRTQQLDFGAFLRYVQTEPLESQALEELPADRDRYVSAGAKTSWKIGQSVGLGLRYTIRFRLQDTMAGTRTDRTEQRFTVALGGAMVAR